MINVQTGPAGLSTFGEFLPEYKNDYFYVEGWDQVSVYRQGRYAAQKLTIDELYELFVEPKPSIQEYHKLFRIPSVIENDEFKKFRNDVIIDDDLLLSIGNNFQLIFDGEDERIRYVPVNKAHRAYNPFGQEVNEGLYTSLPVVRFLRRHIFTRASDAELEAMFAYARAALEEYRINIREVTGEEILWAYHEDNYDHDYDLGDMRESCMREEVNQKAIQWYADQDNCACLVATHIVNNEEKVLGRAIIWTTDSGERCANYTYASAATKVLFNLYYKKNNIHDTNWLAYNAVVTTKGYVPNKSYFNFDENLLPALDGMRTMSDHKTIKGAHVV